MLLIPLSNNSFFDHLTATAGGDCFSYQGKQALFNWYSEQHEDKEEIIDFSLIVQSWMEYESIQELTEDWASLDEIFSGEELEELEELEDNEFSEDHNEKAKQFLLNSDITTIIELKNGGVLAQN